MAPSYLLTILLCLLQTGAPAEVYAGIDRMPRQRAAEAAHCARRSQTPKNDAAPATAAQPVSRRLSTMQRLEKAYLEKARAAVAEFARNRKDELPKLPGGLKDWRCILHCHSYLSHDSRGSIAEIAAAAKHVGVDAIFLSDHPQKTLDVVTAGHRGEVDGVLFVPGSETNGFLVYPGTGRLPDLQVNEQTLCDTILAGGGMLFIAHPEEHTNWNLSSLTGMEIYNTHADLKDETELLNALQPKNAIGYLQLLRILNTMQEYPREAFACLFDAPVENLAHYDAGARRGRLAAVAGNDSHQNTGFVVYGTADGKYRLEDVLGKPLGVLDPAKNNFLKSLFGEPAPGKELFRRILDPYPVSLGYVSTHVLAPERSETALRTALAEARTYVAFDWMADPAGTAFLFTTGNRTGTIGDSEPLAPGMTLHVRVPVPATLRLYRDGKQVARTQGLTLDFPVSAPGVYRMEALLPLVGEERPWIYTGAIRIR